MRPVRLDVARQQHEDRDDGHHAEQDDGDRRSGRSASATSERRSAHMPARPVSACWAVHPGADRTRPCGRRCSTTSATPWWANWARVPTAVTRSPGRTGTSRLGHTTGGASAGRDDQGRELAVEVAQRWPRRRPRGRRRGTRRPATVSSWTRRPRQISTTEGAANAATSSTQPSPTTSASACPTWGLAMRTTSRTSGRSLRTSRAASSAARSSAARQSTADGAPVAGPRPVPRAACRAPAARPIARAAVRRRRPPRRRRRPPPRRRPRRAVVRSCAARCRPHRTPRRGRASARLPPAGG